MEHRLALILGDTPLVKRIGKRMSEFAWVYHVDVKSYSDVAALLEALRPKVVVNAIEVDDMGLCERAPDVAIGANALGAANVAMACRLYDVGLIHLSTDKVFGSVGPYKHDDLPYPQTSYGVSKLLGEHAVLDILPEKSTILRYGNLYGAEDEICQPYIAMTQGGLRVNKGPETAYIDHTAFVTPTYIGHVARVVGDLLAMWAVTADGVDVPVEGRARHIAPGEDPITWHDLLVNDFQVRPYTGAKTLQKFRIMRGLVPTPGWATPGYREGLDAFIKEFREVQHSQAGTSA